MLVMVAACTGETPRAPRSRDRDLSSRCPSDAGCGPSVYGVVRVHGCADEPLPDPHATVLVHEIGDGSRRLVALEGTEAAGVYAISLGERGQYALSVFDPSYGGQLPITPDPSSGRGRSYVPVVVDDEPVERDLYFTIFCDDVSGAAVG